jgi:hypothetical protein
VKRQIISSDSEDEPIVSRALWTDDPSINPSIPNSTISWLEHVPNDIFKVFCEKMDLQSLQSFIQSHKKASNTCSPIFRKRFAELKAKVLEREKLEDAKYYGRVYDGTWGTFRRRPANQMITFRSQQPNTIQFDQYEKQLMRDLTTKELRDEAINMDALSAINFFLTKNLYAQKYLGQNPKFIFTQITWEELFSYLEKIPVEEITEIIASSLHSFFKMEKFARQFHKNTYKDTTNLNAFMRTYYISKLFHGMNDDRAPLDLFPNANFQTPYLSLFYSRPEMLFKKSFLTENSHLLPSPMRTAYTHTDAVKYWMSRLYETEQ